MSSLGAYIFGNVFYYLYWNNDTSIMNKYWNSSSSGNQKYNDNQHSKQHQNESFVPYLITQMKTKRTLKPHPFGRRSKYIVKPEGVVMAGNHLVHKFVDGEYYLKYELQQSKNNYIQNAYYFDAILVLS